MADTRFELRKITVADIIEICAAGVRDFAAAPKYGLFLAGLFVLAGWLIVALLFHFKILYLAYPLAMGFALISPFAAVGFYAVSHRLEKRQTLTFASVFADIRNAMKGDLRWMALVTGFALVIWMDIAAFLFFALMGFQGFGPDFLEKLFTTPTGLFFLLLGNTSGAFIALLVFSISVISFPLLFANDVDFVTAMTTSARLVAENPAAMVFWCALVGLLTLLSIASLFIGLLVVLPVVGHATWHLYRKAVVISAPVEPTANAA